MTIKHLETPSLTGYLNTDHLLHSVALDFIESGQFLMHEGMREIPTNNRRHRLFEVPIGAPPEICIMKVFDGGRRHRIRRRLEVCISEFCRQRFRRGFFLALQLHRAGFDTAVPIAYWQDRRPRFGGKRYLLYRKINTAQTLKDYLEACTAEERIHHLQQFGRLQARLHDSGLRHSDVAFSNFLISCDSQPKLIVLDADALRNISRLWRGFVLVGNMWALRRFPRTCRDEEHFLAGYFGQEPSRLQVALFRFWRSPLAHPLRSVRGLLVSILPNQLR